jgi:hypothetical protein
MFRGLLRLPRGLSLFIPGGPNLTSGKKVNMLHTFFPERLIPTTQSQNIPSIILLIY